MRSMLILLLLLLVACQPAVVQQPENITKTECKPPYFEYTPGDCCLDSEPNRICDRYENRTIAVPKNLTTGPQAPPSSAVIDALAKYRQNVTGYSYQVGDTEYFVMGDLARVKLDKMKRLEIKINNTIPVTITDIYIDRGSREAVGYCDPRTEKELMGEFDYERSPCADIINTPISLKYADYNPILPQDWLTRFANIRPTIVESTDQYIKDFTGWKAVNPILHFVENDVEYVLRLELKTGLPIKVEIKEGEKETIITFNNFIHNSVKPQEVAYQKFHN